ncbi:hypothetical protein BpHYR1_041674 [Brachionus plicatilis]|uniref:Uncharacterized protein n=1 Tax=Brachionus plicatilis TaxID=10195 RepID=A0A3M7STC5_BRAPC|nr:hypothetical protein BpHYR1_041674 [Brachionus plicatilis]
MKPNKRWSRILINPASSFDDSLRVLKLILKCLICKLDVKLDTDKDKKINFLSTNTNLQKGMGMEKYTQKQKIDSIIILYPENFNSITDSQLFSSKFDNLLEVEIQMTAPKYSISSPYFGRKSRRTNTMEYSCNNRSIQLNITLITTKRFRSSSLLMLED